MLVLIFPTLIRLINLSTYFSKNKIKIKIGSCRMFYIRERERERDQ